ncbi:hypothetical protein DFQ26_006028 [Actinomortierella ambigua]|nr:hypothetical protein DFQ26_006028 [Actinomortierella ambigua]
MYDLTTHLTIRRLHHTDSRPRSRTRSHSRRLVIEESLLRDYRLQGRPNYESVGRDHRLYDHEQDRGTWGVTHGSESGEEGRWQQQQHAHDQTKDPTVRSDADPHPPSESTAFGQRTGAPRMQTHSPSSSSHMQPRQPHHQLTPPPPMHRAPVREDTIPSYGISSATHFQHDHKVKEEEEEADDDDDDDDEGEEEEDDDDDEDDDDEEKGGSWDTIGHVRHLQHHQGISSPHAYPASSTPLQSSPSLSASTPPATTPGNTALDPSGKMMLPSSSGTGASGYTSTSRKPRPYPCAYPGCGRVFEKRCNMLSHHWTHFPSEMPRHPCPTCGKSFTRMHDVQRHISTVHEGSRNFVCAGCRRAFARRNGLNRHQQQSELCRGTGVLTPAEAAAIGGLPPAAARGPRGRKPPLHVPASPSHMVGTMVGPQSHMSSDSRDYIDGGSFHGAATDMPQQQSFSYHAPPPPGSIYPDTEMALAGGPPLKIESDDMYNTPSGRIHPSLTRTTPLQYEGQVEERRELDGERRREEDAYRDHGHGVDRLQDNRNVDPENRIVHDRLQKPTTMSCD